jgi:DNA-binding PadR family transcriptional regulator
LVRQELVTPTEPPGEEADPRRNYYGITQLGRQVLAADTARMRTLLESVDESGVLVEGQ